MTHLSTIKSFLALIPNIMPDITTTITVINAPAIFSTIYKFLAPVIPIGLRRKLRIVRHNQNEHLEGLANLQAFPEWCKSHAHQPKAHGKLGRQNVGTKGR